MPRASSGTCTLAEDAFVPNTTIVSADMNSDLSDIISMMTDSLSRSGKGGMSAALDMNSHQINELTAGTAATDATNLTQVQTLISNVTTGIWVAAGGTANAITATYSPAVTALTDGQILYARASLDNTSTTPTFSPNGLTAHTIVKGNGVALVAGDIAANSELILRYNLANTRWELLNPLNPGEISGPPVNKTTAYAVVNADKGKTFYLTGTSYYTITVGVASGFDADFQCRLVNQDSRGKLMAINGITNFILWPAQSITLINTNNTWNSLPLSQRWVTKSAVTINVNSSLGSDSNDGLGTGSGALATAQAAYNLIRDQIDHAGGTPTMSLASGMTFALGAGLNINYPLVGARQLQITGAGSSSVLECSPGGGCLIGRDLSTFTIASAKLRTTGNGSTAISASNNATADVGTGVTFDDFPIGIGMNCTSNATINVLLSYTMSGTIGSNLHLNASFGGYINYGGITVTLTNAQAFTVFAAADSGGYINYGGAGVTFAGAGAGGGSTGTRYSSSNNAIMSTGGQVYPGNVAGTTANGGLYS